MKKKGEKRKKILAIKLIKKGQWQKEVLNFFGISSLFSFFFFFFFFFIKINMSADSVFHVYVILDKKNKILKN